MVNRVLSIAMDLRRAVRNYGPVGRDCRLHSHILAGGPSGERPTCPVFSLGVLRKRAQRQHMETESAASAEIGFAQKSLGVSSVHLSTQEALPDEYHWPVRRTDILVRTCPH